MDGRKNEGNKNVRKTKKVINCEKRKKYMMKRKKERKTGSKKL